MVKGKKLAMFLKKSDKLVVKRSKESIWITDTFILFKLSIEEGLKFLDKWDSYKSTMSFPPIEAGETYELICGNVAKSKDDIISTVIDRFNFTKEVEITRFKYDIYDTNKTTTVTMCKAEGCKPYDLIFNSKYEELIDESKIDKVMTNNQENFRCFGLFRKGKIIGLIMGMSNKKHRADIKKEFENLIKEG